MGFTAILPYIDPALVIGIVIVAFPTPVKSLIIELKNLLLISPENYIEHEVKRHIKPLIKRYNLINMGIYAIKTGRVYQLFLYTDIEGDSITIEYLDKIRLDIRKEISKLYNKHYTDVIFSKIDADTPNEI